MLGKQSRVGSARRIKAAPLTSTCPCLLLQERVFLPQQFNLTPQQSNLSLTWVVLNCWPVVDVLGAGGVAQSAQGLLHLASTAIGRLQLVRQAPKTVLWAAGVCLWTVAMRHQEVCSSRCSHCRTMGYPCRLHALSLLKAPKTSHHCVIWGQLKILVYISWLCAQKHQPNRPGSLMVNSMRS